MTSLELMRAVLSAKDRLHRNHHWGPFVLLVCDRYRDDLLQPYLGACFTSAMSVERRMLQIDGIVKIVYTTQPGIQLVCMPMEEVIQ